MYVRGGTQTQSQSQKRLMESMRMFETRLPESPEEEIPCTAKWAGWVGEAVVTEPGGEERAPRENARGPQIRTVYAWRNG